MKKTLPHILIAAVLATSTSAQLQFDDHFHGSQDKVTLSFAPNTVNPPVFSQWVAEESAAFHTSASWQTPSPIGAPFTMSEAGAASAVSPATLTSQHFGLWNGNVAAPTAGPPQTGSPRPYSSWSTTSDGKNPSQFGPQSKQDMANERQFHLPQDWSSSPTTISRLQPFNDVTPVPEPSTIGAASLLLVFVAIHFFRQRRKQKATA